MANQNPKTEHLITTQWSSGVSGNPAGAKPGSKHLSTWVQEMLNDESFEMLLGQGPYAVTEVYKGAPIRAIVKTAIVRAANGDIRWADWIAKYGFGTKIAVSGQDPPVPILLGITKYGDMDPEAAPDVVQSP
jgi:hypothetical protein